MSSTFQAHSLSVAASLAVQKIITEPLFIESVESKGEFIRTYLTNTIGSHPYVKDIRGRGVRNSIEFDCNNVNLFTEYLGSVLYHKHRIICSSKWHRLSFCHAMNLEWDLIKYYLDTVVHVFCHVSDLWGENLISDFDNPHHF